MAGHPTARSHLTLLKAWHAWLAGAFLVAYVTAGEDAYAIHQFAGYAVLAAIAVRVVAGLLIPAPSPLRLPRPSWQATRDWLRNRKGRHPLFALFAATLLAIVGMVAASGALADGTPWFEDPHEAIAEASLWVIAGHVAFVTYIYAGKKWLKQIASRLVPGQDERAS
jgi:cytochrome b